MHAGVCVLWFDAPDASVMLVVTSCAIWQHCIRVEATASRDIESSGAQSSRREVTAGYRGARPAAEKKEETRCRILVRRLRD